MLHQIRLPSNKVTTAACPLLAIMLAQYTCCRVQTNPLSSMSSASLQGLLLCMANCAMVFFMFSYQARLQASCSDLTKLKSWDAASVRARFIASQYACCAS